MRFAKLIIPSILVMLGAAIVLTFGFAAVEAARIELGFESVDLKESTNRAILLATACAIGVVSKFIFDNIEIDKNYQLTIYQTVKFVIRKSIIALIVCPVVIAGIYGLLSEIKDPILLSLIAYQNGFFFQTILSKANPITEHSQ